MKVFIAVFAQKYVDDFGVQIHGYAAILLEKVDGELFSILFLNIDSDPANPVYSLCFCFS